MLCTGARNRKSYAQDRKQIVHQSYADVVVLTTHYLLLETLYARGEGTTPFSSWISHLPVHLRPMNFVLHAYSIERTEVNVSRAYNPKAWLRISLGRR